MGEDHDPLEDVKDLYLDLLDREWTLPEIDGMDILYFFELSQHRSKKKKQPKQVYIDQIPFL